MTRLKLEAPEGHPTRVRWYRAPDPAWADPELLERIRLALVAEDRRLNLWWNPNWKHDDPEHPGRWAVMYWQERQGAWCVVFYFEGAAGEYRPVDANTTSAILHRLRRTDVSVPAMIARIADERARRVAKQTRELSDALQSITRRGIERLKRNHKGDTYVAKIMAETEAETARTRLFLETKHAQENAAAAARLKAEEFATT